MLMNVEMTSTRASVGKVVYAMDLMCAYRSVLAAMAARTVVSETGDILSPKQAPETMAPATTGSGIPMASPMPIRTMPAVPAVPQLVPVAIDMAMHSTMAVGRKMAGEMNSIP